MGQVRIGHQFFRNELRVYRDANEAFWRENVQNSVDAGSTSIDVRIDAERDGITHIEFLDNGCGMTRETLEDVYFQLGETTKTGSSVGGFGKARILCCFAQKAYRIHTGNLVVDGQGSEYTISNTESNYNGVWLSVDVVSEGADLESVLKQYLRKCYLPSVTIRINGERWREWTPRNRHARELSFGHVYTNKSQYSGVYVRVSGVQMFAPYCVAPFQIVVEIDPSRSREVLQASRDGLIYKYQNELESFISELNINKQSALREKRSKSIRYNGSGTFTSRRTESKSADQVIEELNQSLTSNGYSCLDDRCLRLINNSTNPEAVGVAIMDRWVEDGIISPRSRVAAKAHNSGCYTDEYTREHELFSMIVEDQTYNAEVRKVIESYYPENWRLTGRYGSRLGLDKFKLLVMWKEACKYCLDILQNKLHRGPEEIAWSVGWIFSDEAEAMHKGDGQTSWLLLNPCKPTGRMRWSMSDKKDLCALVGIAAHEVVHAVYEDHDERFANLLNELLNICLFEINDIVGAMKKAKEEAVKVYELI